MYVLCMCYVDDCMCYVDDCMSWGGLGHIYNDN